MKRPVLDVDFFTLSNGNYATVLNPISCEFIDFRRLLYLVVLSLIPILFQAYVIYDL